MSNIAKFLVALAGLAATAAGEAINAGLVSGAAGKWTAVIVGALGPLATAIGVYLVPNAPAALPTPPAKQAAQKKPATTT